MENKTVIVAENVKAYFNRGEYFTDKKFSFVVLIEPVIEDNKEVRTIYFNERIVKNQDLILALQLSNKSRPVKLIVRKVIKNEFGKYFLSGLVFEEEALKTNDETKSTKRSDEDLFEQMLNKL